MFASKAIARLREKQSDFPALSLRVLVGLTMVLSGCRGLVGNQGNPSNNLQSVNHIIFMAQENRGFDHYFGAMRQYWAANGIPDQAFDGLPQFNPTAGPAPTNPGCDPRFAFPPNDCTIGGNSPKVASFAMVSMCVENPSPSWNEDHVDWNLHDPLSSSPSLDGFVWTAAHDARTNQPPFTDVDGVRAMGHYDGTDLPWTGLPDCLNRGGNPRIETFRGGRIWHRRISV